METTCDNCKTLCDKLVGDDDHGWFCCHCVEYSFDRVYWTATELPLCEKCAANREGHATGCVCADCSTAGVSYAEWKKTQDPMD